MKAIIVTLFVSVLIFVKSSHGYLCFECNSLNNTNCFDLTPQSNVFIAVSCESTDKVQKTCYSVHISEHKKRRMVRGCGAVGICDELKKVDQSNVYMDVLACGECDDQFCNKSSVPFISYLLLSLVHLHILFVLCM